jgi:hypothetical protein
MHPFVAESAAVLERTPQTLRTWLEGLPEAWTEAREGPESFSPRDVVGHLIHGEDTDWIPRLRLILARGDAEPFAPFDRFGFRERLRGRPMGELLGEFAGKRAANLAVLRGSGIGEPELALPGRHPELGRVTLRQLVATWVVHDLNHLGQIARVMARRQREAVGPWRAYLGILG